MDTAPPTHRLGHLSIVLLAGALVALGACGSSGSKSNGTNAPSNSTHSTNSSNSTTASSGGTKSSSSAPSTGIANGKLCDTFTLADAAKLFGEPAAVTPNPAADPLGGEQCIYQNKNRGGSGPYWLLQVRHETNPAAFDGTHVVSKTYTNLWGIGDAAFTSPAIPSGSGWDVQVKKGHDVYLFELTVSGGNATASQDALVALVRSKLG